MGSNDFDELLFSLHFYQQRSQKLKMFNILTLRSDEACFPFVSCFHVYYNFFRRIQRRKLKIGARKFKENTVQKQPQKQRCSLDKGVFLNFAKFTGKLPRQSLFFNKVTGPRRLWYKCLAVNFEKFLRKPFLLNTSGRLLLTFKTSSFLELLQAKKSVNNVYLGICK